MIRKLFSLILKNKNLSITSQYFWYQNYFLNVFTAIIYDKIYFAWKYQKFSTKDNRQFTSEKKLPQVPCFTCF